MGSSKLSTELFAMREEPLYNSTSPMTPVSEFALSEEKSRAVGDGNVNPFFIIHCSFSEEHCGREACHHLAHGVYEIQLMPVY